MSAPWMTPIAGAAWPPDGARAAPGVVPHLELPPELELPPLVALLALREGEYAAPGVRAGATQDEGATLDVPRGALAAILPRPEELELLHLTLRGPDGAPSRALLSNRSCGGRGRVLAALVNLDGQDPALLWPEVPPVGLAASPRLRLQVLLAWSFEIDPDLPTLAAVRARRMEASETAARADEALALGRALLEADPSAVAARADWRCACATNRHDRRFAAALGLARAEDALRLPTPLGRRADPTGLAHLPRDREPAALTAARTRAAGLGSLAEVGLAQVRPAHGILPDLPSDPHAAAEVLARAFSFLVPALPPEADR